MMRMRGGLKLPFKLLGIPVSLDNSFLLILPLFAYLIGSQLPAFVAQLRVFGIEVPASDIATGATPWLLGVVAALGLFTSVVIHELGHALVARLYGVQVTEIRLWFLGGVAQFEELPSRRGAEAVVAIAGPLTSGLLALLLWLVLPLAGGAAGVTVVLAYLAITNLGLAIFNLLPALPLDGGRVVRSLFGLFLPHLRATNIAVALSAAIAIAMGIYGVFNGQLFLVIMAFFVYNAGRAEAQAAYLKDALEGLEARDLMTAEPLTVEPDMPLSQFLRLGEFRRHTGYPVVDEAGRLLGMALLSRAGGTASADRTEGDATGRFPMNELSAERVNVENRAAENMAADALQTDRPPAGTQATDALATDALPADASVADLLVPVEGVAPDLDAMEAIHRLSRSAVGRLVVVDEGERVIGIISKTDAVRLLSAQAAQRAARRQRPD